MITEKHGPFGSKNPLNWKMELDEGTCVKEVIIHHGFIVDSIGFLIVDNNGRTTTNVFGGRGGAQSKEKEFITHISGRYGVYIYTHDHVISSLIIHTNLCSGGYGPYGDERDVRYTFEFSTPVATGDDHGGRIFEFFGRHDGRYLQSLGLSIKKR